MATLNIGTERNQLMPYDAIPVFSSKPHDRHCLEKVPINPLLPLKDQRINPCQLAAVVLRSHHIYVCDRNDHVPTNSCPAHGQTNFITPVKVFRPSPCCRDTGSWRPLGIYLSLRSSLSGGMYVCVGVFVNKLSFIFVIDNLGGDFPLGKSLPKS